MIHHRESSSRGSTSLGVQPLVLMDRGMFSGGLWVLRDNGAARDFYEALGGESQGRKSDSVGGQIVQLVGYWWRDIAQLAERSTQSISPGRF